MKCFNNMNSNESNDIADKDIKTISLGPSGDPNPNLLITIKNLKESIDEGRLDKMEVTHTTEDHRSAHSSIHAVIVRNTIILSSIQNMLGEMKFKEVSSFVGSLPQVNHLI